MASLRDRLPPINALVVFEAAARHLSFTRAAHELHVTQAAVSRQIRDLEAHLGAALFRRHYRAVSLTVEGERLRTACVAGLQEIARAVADIRRSRAASKIVVTTTIAFGALWLMPRIPAFRAAHPEVALRLVTSDPHDGVRDAEMDVGVRYGTGGWPRLAATRLFADRLVPVCSPAYHARHGPFTEPAAWSATTLLEMEPPDPGWVDWEAWFAAMGDLPRPADRIRFNNYLLVVQAALAGEGIAIGWQRLIVGHLEAGLLVPAVERAIDSPGAYYLVTPEAAADDRAVGIFRDWLIAQAGSPDRPEKRDAQGRRGGEVERVRGIEPPS